MKDNLRKQAIEKKIIINKSVMDYCTNCKQIKSTLQTYRPDGSYTITCSECNHVDENFIVKKAKPKKIEIKDFFKNAVIILEEDSKDLPQDIIDVLKIYGRKKGKNIKLVENKKGITGLVSRTQLMNWLYLD